MHSRGQFHFEGRPPSGALTRGPDASTVRVDDAAADGQTKSESSAARLPSLPLERLEQPAQRGRIQTDARIAYRDPDATRFVIRGVDLNRAAVRELDGVGQQVRDDLPKTSSIAVDVVSRRVEAAAEHDRFLPHQRSARFNGLAYGRVYVNRPQRQVQAA